MAEFAAFHYLMHKNVKGVGGPAPSMSMDAFAKQFGGGAVEKGPPTFQQLYSPRPTRQLHVAEKLYWRTNDRIEYRFVEVRHHCVLVIVCFNITTAQEYRPLCVDASLLYRLVENKKQGKAWSTAVEKRVLSDADLKAAVADFLLSRLKLSEPSTDTELTPDGLVPTTERHCFLDKSFGDEYDTLLREPPPAPLETLLDGVDRKGTPIWLPKQVDAPSPTPPSTSLSETEVEAPPPTEVAVAPAGGSGVVAARVLKSGSSPPKKDVKPRQSKGGDAKISKSTTQKPGTAQQKQKS